MPSLAGKRQEILVTAISTSDTGKPTAKDATIKVAVNYLSYIGAEKAILFGKALIIDLFKFFRELKSDGYLKNLVGCHIFRLEKSRLRLKKSLTHQLFSK